MGAEPGGYLRPTSAAQRSSHVVRRRSVPQVEGSLPGKHGFRSAVLVSSERRNSGNGMGSLAVRERLNWPRLLLLPDGAEREKKGLQIHE